MTDERDRVVDAGVILGSAALVYDVAWYAGNKIRRFFLLNLTGGFPSWEALLGY